MSVVTRPFAGFYRSFSNDRPSHKTLVSLSDSDRVFDAPHQVSAASPLAPEIDRFTLGTEPHEAVVEAPSFDTTLETGSAHEETWAALEVEKSLGQLMTEARDRRGLSRAEAAEQTNIPEYYIRMIESDCYDAIPDQLYLLPFFERYAIVLGIDAQQVVTRFLRDFEKAENEIVAAPASSRASHVPATNVLHRWRRIAEAAAIVGVLLPLVGWEVGKMRAANHHNADVASVATISPATKAPPSIQPNNAPPPVVAPPSPPPEQAVASSAAPIAPEQVAPAPQTPIRSHRHSRSHRISHHGRHLKRGVS